MADNGTNIAKAYVQIVPSAKGIKDNLSNVFNSEMPSAGQDAGGIFGSNLIGTITSLIAAAGIGKLLSDSITSGADLEQSLGGIETLFKDSADLVIQNAEQAYKTAGMSANEYMETVTSFSASLLQGLSGDTEAAAIVADMALTDMADNANKMGTSMELIQNAYQGFAKQNYTMLDNLKLGYGGTKTEMERLLADAQALTGVEYNIDNLADVYEAIHVIQEEMGITGTTAKEAAETLAGSGAAMKAAFSDVLANLATGRDIEQPLQALTDSAFTYLVGNLLPAVGNVFSGIPAVLSSAFSAAIQGMNMAANNADAILQQGIDLVVGIGSAIITALPYLADSAISVVMSLGNAIINTDWIQIGTETINNLRDSLDLAAMEILGTDGNIVQSVIDAIISGFPSLLDSGISMGIEMSNGLFAGIPRLLDTASDMLVQLVHTIAAALPDMVSGGMDLVAKLASGLDFNVPEIIKSASALIADLLATIAGYLPDLFENGLALIGEMIAGLIAAIPDVVAAIPDIIDSIVEEFSDWNWADIGGDIISGIANGIMAGAGAIWDAASTAASNALEAAKDFLGIASPSKVMRDEIGKFIPEGVAEGIKANTDPISSAMHDMSDVTASTLYTDLHLSADSKAAAPARMYGDSSFVVQVYGTAGQSVDELAEVVMQRMQMEVARREAQLA